MNGIPKYNFYRKKYGDELLIDVIDLESIKGKIRKTPVHRVTYYDITFITEGSEEVGLNDRTYTVAPGSAVCSIPGDVWTWEPNTRMNGYVLVFEEEFLLSFFNDPFFLRKFAYLNPQRESAHLCIEDQLFSRVMQLLLLIKDEINNYAEKDHHMLRAMLYEVLMLLHRSYISAPSNPEPPKDIAVDRYIYSFVQMVNDGYTSQRNVQDYADRLFISTNYLNRIVRQTLGVTTKQYIQNKVMQEAKRLLTYTTLSVAEIAATLHFETASYFIRFFRKHAGNTPREYRESLVHRIKSSAQL